MSVHYEWFDTRHPFFAVTYLPAEHDVFTGLPADEDTDEEYHAERGAILVSADEVAVLHGTPAELRAALQRALDLLPPELSDSYGHRITVI